MSSKKVYRAGIIPFYLKEGIIKMLFMLPSNPKYGGDCFQVAKGKREEGEEDEETAFREAKEELGLFKGNCKGAHKLGNFLGRTMIYVVEIEDPDFFGDPHFETKETKWMSPDEYQSEGRDLHKPIVRAAVRHIEEKQKEQKLEEEYQEYEKSLYKKEYFYPTLYEMTSWDIKPDCPLKNSTMMIRCNSPWNQDAKNLIKIINENDEYIVYNFEDKCIVEGNPAIYNIEYLHDVFDRCSWNLQEYVNMVIGSSGVIESVDRAISEQSGKIITLTESSSNMYFNPLFEMANLLHKDTGLMNNNILWTRPEPGEHGHVKYRVKIINKQLGDAVFALWGDQFQQIEQASERVITGKELRQIQLLLTRTHKGLVQYINGEMSDADIKNYVRQRKV